MVSGLSASGLKCPTMLQGAKQNKRTVSEHTMADAVGDVHCIQNCCLYKLQHQQPLQVIRRVDAGTAAACAAAVIVVHGTVLAAATAASSPPTKAHVSGFQADAA